MENINKYTYSAKYYDIYLKENKVGDIPLYLEYAKKQNGRILELGCGTGRVSIGLANMGFSVIGLDLSESMLEIFDENIKLLPKDIQNNIKKLNCNISDFNLNEKFSLIIAPFRTFQFLTNDNDIKNCLNCIKNHLNNNGLFILNVFRPLKTLDESWCFNEVVQWKYNDNGIDVVKKDCGEKIDVKNQILNLKFILEMTDKNGNMKKYEDYLEMKYYYYEQIKELLENNGFNILEEFGNYNKCKIEDGNEMIIICDKKR